MNTDAACTWVHLFYAFAMPSTLLQQGEQEHPSLINTCEHKLLRMRIIVDLFPRVGMTSQTCVSDPAAKYS